MKTPLKAVVTAALAAGILLGGPAMANADDNVSAAPATASMSAASQLDRLITLKPGTVTVSDQLGESSTSGLPWISQEYPFSQNGIAASRMLTAADHSTWRMISMANCGIQSAFYVADSDVATDVERPAGQHTARLHVGAATEDNAAITDYAHAFTGKAVLPPGAGIYASYGSQAEPVYEAIETYKSTPWNSVRLEFMTVPATTEFEVDGQAWRQIIAPGMTEGFVRASAVYSFEPTTCQNGAIPFATTDLDAAATATVESSEQGGNPAGIWMLAGGAVAVTAATGILIARSTKTKVSK